MLSYEVAPPPEVWKKIAVELDESELDHVFPSALYQAKAAPPAVIWSKIQIALDAGHEAAVPEHRRFSPFLRYAAAAVVIGLVAWGGLQLLNSKRQDKNIVSSGTSTPSQLNPETSATRITDIATESRQPDINADKTEEARNDAALEASKKTFAKLDMPVNSRRLKNIATAYRFASSSQANEPEDSYADDVSSRYIVLMTPDGHFIRMSKKLDNMVCCVSGEEQDKDCKDQMTRWREKMACSPTGHSTGSFLDILSLLKSLEDQ